MSQLIEWHRSIPICVDEFPDSPLNYGLCKFICFHDRYRLGHEHSYNHKDYSGWDELKEAIVEGEKEAGNPVAIIEPLFLMDHSSISLSVSSGQFRAQDPGRWDWGMVGFVILSEKDLKELESWRDGDSNPIPPEKYIEDHLTEYSGYLNGECCMFPDAWYAHLDSYDYFNSLCEARKWIDRMWEKQPLKVFRFLLPGEELQVLAPSEEIAEKRLENFLDSGESEDNPMMLVERYSRRGSADPVYTGSFQVTEKDMSPFRDVKKD